MLRMRATMNDPILNNIDFNQLRNLAIGTVESVSPTEIKVLLDINAPQSTAINTGVPTLFPKINAFVLVPNETGALVGIISWMGVEYSTYPKRKGLRDFDVIDLPYPQRKVSVNPLGILKNTGKSYELERGVFSFPSVGDAVIMPTPEQLNAIIENRDKRATINIGTSPIAANAQINVDADKLFGRHLAVLGNTGSGKSCSVAGLIRWSLEAAQKVRGKERPNARFIVLDPNGEYSQTFDDFGDRVRKFSVKFDEEDVRKQLRVPAWMWNSYEWSAVTQASGKTQRPLLRRALRELRSPGAVSEQDDEMLRLRRYYSSCLIELKKDLSQGATAFKGKPGKNDFGRKLHSISADAKSDSQKTGDEIQANLALLAEKLEGIANTRYKSFKKDGETIEYYDDFEKSEVENAVSSIDSFLSTVGGFQQYQGPDEDSPVNFDGEDLPNHLERLAQEQNVQQFLDFLIMRVRTMLSDSRMASIIGTRPRIEFSAWLDDYIGKDSAENGEIAVIDLSIVPAEVVHLVVAVIARIVFESLQRYRKLNRGEELPTIMVMEEAHTFIKRYLDGTEEISPEKMCCQTFERIAREGRKFGLGLVLSSQRPSELSPTVLSQCNTFLLHRIVNDRDQELVKNLVPDTLGSFLSELPVLPTRKAILLGWATPIPVLVEMNELEEDHRPDSKDPRFWDVWTGIQTRPIDWKRVAEDWQNVKKADTADDGES